LGSGIYGLFQSTILEFVLERLRKPQQTSVWIASNLAKCVPPVYKSTMLMLYEPAQCIQLLCTTDMITWTYIHTGNMGRNNNAKAEVSNNKVFCQMTALFFCCEQIHMGRE
jgi:hypothetical protein